MTYSYHTWHVRVVVLLLRSSKAVYPVHVSMYRQPILFVSLLVLGIGLLSLTVDAFSARNGNVSPHHLVPPMARGESRFFLDTASIDEWNELIPLGIFHGITTNPTILERCGVSCTVASVHELAATALGMVDEFLCQAWGSMAEEMYNVGIIECTGSRTHRHQVPSHCGGNKGGIKAHQ